MAGDRRIAQVFTSTFAGGMYSRDADPADAAYQTICSMLLRAAYLGTLFAAVALGRSRAVLTLIGGGAFGNPVPLIWNSTGWALDQEEPFVDGTLDVVVNGRSLGHHIRREDIVAAVRARGGAMVVFGPSSSVSVRR